MILADIKKKSVIINLAFALADVVATEFAKLHIQLIHRYQLETIIRKNGNKYSFANELNNPQLRENNKDY